ncbi:E3 ubiquitin-protein ligase Mdm2-like [Thrips palmi]|uniref:E3 ubiquitin-protein ligase Mdm2-like n=1 Tax=Thrips palmi TaxID=161013 RepID=A0A6P8YJ22_THRPL|nr:E3 ubiquitin-protein ligase Mdm2-like [Thrips palmi]
MDVVCVPVPRFSLGDVCSAVNSIMTREFKLESESDLSPSDMDESVCSAQEELTASCQDTPDTESESSSLESEFSVASSASHCPTLPEISSGPEDIYEAANLAFATAKQSRCIRCHNVKSSPFLYCRGCHKDRKRFFPPCPRRKKKVIGKLNSSIKSSEPNSSQSTSDEMKPDETSVRPTVCGCCMDAPCNGIFVHGDVGHQIYCYRCSHRLWLERKLCPYCNRSISKVVKLFQVV